MRLPTYPRAPHTAETPLKAAVAVGGQADADETSQKQTLSTFKSAILSASPTASPIGGITSLLQMSIFSAISIASSTSMLTYLRPRPHLDIQPIHWK